jgi:FkbM family methyltransferase
MSADGEEMGQNQTLAAEKGLRQRIAAMTPGLVRKPVRMAENYVNRLRTWGHLRRELVAGNPASRAVLRRSLSLAPLTSLAKLDSFQGPRLAGDIEVEVTGVGRFALRAGTDDVLHVMTSREPYVRRAIEARLPKGGTFVDAGANIGFYSVLAARLVGPEGRVVAFEMMPDTAAILRRHVALNAPDRIEIVENAISDRNGATVTATVEPGKHGQASIIASASPDGRVAIEVATITLDTALAGAGRIDVLKMDLEGAEYLALQGAAEVLGRTSSVVFESNDNDRRVFDLLESHGFTVELLAGHDFIALASARS